ncbi:MAG: hypothetical protein WBD22_04830 [Pyrinomonadaceae bacterium]
MSDPRDEKKDPNVQPQILVNDYGAATDPVTVVAEPDRTVVLTKDETIVIEKDRTLDVVPKDRPRKVYAGMWGRTEIATVAFASLAALSVLLLYLFFVRPSAAELEETRARRDKLESELISARSKYGDISSTENQVARLISSVDEFESNNLPISATGRTNLYQKINGLISAYGLVNTTGPDYVPLETEDQNQGQQSDEERGRAKYRSLFPGVYITATLEGSYQNLRRFIREIETGSEFVLVSAVELEPSDAQEEKKSRPEGIPQAPAVTVPDPTDPDGFGGIGGTGQLAQPRARASRGKMHGETVSLRVEMAAYFRRPNYTPQVPEATQ